MKHMHNTISILSNGILFCHQIDRISKRGRIIVYFKTCEIIHRFRITTLNWTAQKRGLKSLEVWSRYNRSIIFIRYDSIIFSNNLLQLCERVKFHFQYEAFNGQTRVLFACYCLLGRVKKKPCFSKKERRRGFFFFKMAAILFKMSNIHCFFSTVQTHNTNMKHVAFAEWLFDTLCGMSQNIIIVGRNGTSLR